MARIRRTGQVLLALGAVAAIAFALPAAAASAAGTDGYATWTITPASGGGYTGTATLPAGFPSVAFTTDSRAPATVSAGTSAWIPTGIGLATIAGSSRNDQYVSIRPKVDTGTPSTTVFTFGAVTPVGGWGFAVGDIDAETVTVSATDAGGNPVAAADLGLQTFNYCDNSFGTSSCPSSPRPIPTPTPAATSISVEDPVCTTTSAPNTCDTDGESFWISPTVPLASLTVVSQGKSGSPAYQAWFGVAPRAISGTLTTDCAVTQPLTAQLLDATGAVVATSPVDQAGAFGFPLVTARADYTLRADPASLPAGATDTATTVDVSAATATGVTVASTCTAAVVTPPADDSSTPEPTLAATGSDPLLPVTAAVLLLGAGLALIGVRRLAR